MSELSSSRSPRRRIAIVGDPATVLGFKGLGFETHAPQAGPPLFECLKQLIYSPHYAIIFMTNAVAEAAAPLLAELESSALPALIPLPMGPKAPDLGRLALEGAVRRAVGFDILSQFEASKETP